MLNNSEVNWNKGKTLFIFGIWPSKKISTQFDFFLQIYWISTNIWSKKINRSYYSNKLVYYLKYKTPFFMVLILYLRYCLLIQGSKIIKKTLINFKVFKWIFFFRWRHLMLHNLVFFRGDPYLFASFAWIKNNKGSQFEISFYLLTPSNRYLATLKAP